MYEIKYNILIPMNYQKESKFEMLYNDFYKGYHFYILSMGTHPTAYVEVAKKKKIPNDLKVEITYDESYLNVGTIDYQNSRFIGWDYAHVGDYIEGINTEGKKYSTEEIVNDCIDVIDKLIGDK